MADSKFQKVSFLKETVFADTTADFSTGILLRTVEKLDLGGVKRGLVEAGVVRTDANDAGLAPIRGLDEIELSVVTLMGGAQRNVGSGAIESDSMTTYLTGVFGTRSTTAEKAAEALSTTTAINSTAHGYDAGDLVMINGIVRRIASKNVNDFTLDFPLPAAPGAADLIRGVEWFEGLDGAATTGLGVSQTDDEIHYVCRGCVPTGIEYAPMTPGETGRLQVTFSGTGFLNSTVTHATTQAGAKGKVVGRGGPGVELKSAAGLLFSPCVSSCTAQSGVSRQWISDIGGDNGKCGVQDIPVDGTFEFTAYQDDTLSTLHALLEQTTTINVQIGEDAGSVIGIYYPAAVLSVAPAPADIEDTQGVSATFRTSRGLIYRA